MNVAATHIKPRKMIGAFLGSPKTCDCDHGACPECAL